MISPIVFNITNEFDMPTQYFIDDFCNVYMYDGINYIPIHTHYRKKDNRPTVVLNLNGKSKQYLAYRLLMKSCSGLTETEFRKYVVDHLDCDTSHNDYGNFELVSQSENMRRAGINNLMPRGEDHHNSKYSNLLINQICQDICNGLSRQEIMQSHNINGQLIDDIKSGRSHKDISSQYLDDGFSYSEYDRSEREYKASIVCDLYLKGNSISDINHITGFGRNFIEPIINKRTFKDISAKYGI